MTHLEVSHIHRTCTRCKITYTYEVQRQPRSNRKRVYRQWACPGCGKERKAFGYRRSVEQLVLTSKADLLVVDGHPIYLPPVGTPDLVNALSKKGNG